MNRELVLRHLTTYWYAPSLGFWRAFEAEQYRALQVEDPVLDLGCGDGSFMHSLGLAGRVVGVDVSPSALRRARLLWPLKELVLADAARLPFPDGSFRTLLSNCVLEHVGPIGPALSEAARVLAPGGTMALSVPGPNSDRWGDAVSGFRAHRARWGHLNIWPATRWTEELRSRGMAVERATPYMTREEYVSFLRTDMAWRRPVIGRLRSAAVLAAGAAGLRRRLAQRWLDRFTVTEDERPARDGAGLFIVARKERSL
jgi:SAM-dependent methyltransferase